MFTYALQKVFEVRHGDVSDVRAQDGDVLSHDGAETILSRLRQAVLLQLLQRAQRWVVSEHTHKHTNTKW